MERTAKSLVEALRLERGETLLIAGSDEPLLREARRRTATVTTAEWRSRLETPRTAFGRSPKRPALPSPSDAYDAVGAGFELVFLPDARAACAELLRVGRPGGRIGITTWAPDGVVGHLFRVVENYLPPAPHLSSPTLWGRPERLEELFAGHPIAIERRVVDFEAASEAAWLALQRDSTALRRAFGALGRRLQDALERDLREVIAHYNESGDGSFRAPARYLEAIVTIAPNHERRRAPRWSPETRLN